LAVIRLTITLAAIIWAVVVVALPSMPPLWPDDDRRAVYTRR
jgi:energy-converting hydrogenase Eha subunit A